MPCQNLPMFLESLGVLNQQKGLGQHTPLKTKRVIDRQNFSDSQALPCVSGWLLCRGERQSVRVDYRLLSC